MQFCAQTNTVQFSQSFFKNRLAYLMSLLLSKMPEREDDHLTPATRLLEKRREMSEVEQALAAQKEVCN